MIRDKLVYQLEICFLSIWITECNISIVKNARSKEKKFIWFRICCLKIVVCSTMIDDREKHSVYQDKVHFTSFSSSGNGTVHLLPQWNHDLYQDTVARRLWRQSQQERLAVVSFCSKIKHFRSQIEIGCSTNTGRKKKKE